MEELFFLIPAFPILIGIGFGICAALFITAFLLERSNDNGNTQEISERFDQSIHIVLADNDLASIKEFTKSPGFHYKDKNPH